MRHHLLAIAFGVAAVGACSSAPAQTPSAENDTCVLLRLAATSDHAPLSEGDDRRVWAMETTPLPRPIYRCGDSPYQTDPEKLGLSYTAVGFSNDRALARLDYQSVAGPLADAGFNCLYEATEEG